VSRGQCIKHSCCVWRSACTPITRRLHSSYCTASEEDIVHTDSTSRRQIHKQAYIEKLLTNEYDGGERPGRVGLRQSVNPQHYRTHFIIARFIISALCGHRLQHWKMIHGMKPKRWRNGQKNSAFRGMTY
jgi:hypothetical protein